MRILITNDDGIYAEGMIPFIRWAQKLGEVTVVAPKCEQSGKSHGIELHKPFEVEEVNLVPGVKSFSVDSTPADCIRFAVLGQKVHYDLVFSGVNKGYNIGGDMIYSGTMGAATEASYLGLKAVAFSTDPHNYPIDLKKMDMVWDFFEKNSLLNHHYLYNVNIPHEAEDIRITRMGGPYYSDDFDKKEGLLYQAHGKCVYEYGTDLDIDTHCVINGHISVTPITIDRTAYDIYDKLK